VSAETERLGVLDKLATRIWSTHHIINHESQILSTKIKQPNTTANQYTFLGFFKFLGTKEYDIYSSVPKLMQVIETDEYMPGMFIG
jgi:hypothetical protein